MEDEGEEVVVTGTRLRDENEASGGSGWAWASFYSTPGGAGADGFDFGGGGGVPTVVVTAPEEDPAEEPPPEEEGEEVIVTAPAPPGVE